MKQLTITYGGVVLFDGEVGEMTWTDSANGVRVEGKTKPGGGGLLDLFTGASKAKTEERIERGRAELAKSKEDHQSLSKQSTQATIESKWPSYEGERQKKGVAERNTHDVGEVEKVVNGNE